MCPLPSHSSLSAFPCLHLRAEKGLRAGQLLATQDVPRGQRERREGRRAQPTSASPGLPRCPTGPRGAGGLLPRPPRNLTVPEQGAAQPAMGRETGSPALLHCHPGKDTGAGEDAGRSIWVHGVNPSPAELPVQPGLCHHG